MTGQDAGQARKESGRTNGMGENAAIGALLDHLEPSSQAEAVKHDKRLRDGEAKPAVEQEDCDKVKETIKRH